MILVCGGFEVNEDMCVDFMGFEWGYVCMCGIFMNCGDGLCVVWSLGV